MRNPESAPALLKAHPLADLFPLLNGAAFDALVEDIRVHGVQERITTHDGLILDGRNRYRGAIAAGVPCPTRVYDGDDPLGFVISANLKRRHQNESSRAMTAAKLATRERGGDQRSDQSANLRNGLTTEQAAQQFSISTRSIESARKVREQGTAKLIDAAEQGVIPVSAAAQLCSRAAAFQDRVVGKIVGEGLPPQEAIRAVLKEDIAQRGTASLDGKYRVFYADPPWQYGNSQPDYFGEQRDHFPTMPLQEICAMPVAEHAEDDAVLFLWVTSPMLFESRAVIEAWGFEYKGHYVWDKIQHVMGHYNSVRHELLLIAVRGSCQPDVRKLFDSVVTEERTGHSVKPEQFYEIIETNYPHGARVELFQRGKARKGWHNFGFEAERDTAAPAQPSAPAATVFVNGGGRS
jgi:N6-adenosine-specific RNA methylase IME4